MISSDDASHRWRGSWLRGPICYLQKWVTSRLNSQINKMTWKYFAGRVRCKALSGWGWEGWATFHSEMWRASLSHLQNLIRRVFLSPLHRWVNWGRQKHVARNPGGKVGEGARQINVQGGPGWCKDSPWVQPGNPSDWMRKTKASLKSNRSHREMRFSAKSEQSLRFREKPTLFQKSTSKVMYILSYPIIMFLYLLLKENNLFSALAVVRIIKLHFPSRCAYLVPPGGSFTHFRKAEDQTFPLSQIPTSVSGGRC